MHVAVTAVGVDRPGIVAAVARALADLGCNIEDSRMAILGGHFAMMLIVATDQAAPDIERGLTEPARALDLGVTVRPVAEAAQQTPEGTEYIVSVYGADRPGIVARVAEALASHGVNIEDLATHQIAGETMLYVMVLEVVVPPDTDASAVLGDLERIGAELGVEVSMHEAETETL